jgi:hypothetical protein
MPLQHIHRGTRYQNLFTNQYGIKNARNENIRACRPSKQISTTKLRNIFVIANKNALYFLFFCIHQNQRYGLTGNSKQDIRNTGLPGNAGFRFG